MKTITIKQKMSNTGTIYDIASDTHDIVVNMGKRFGFVVALPSYYNVRPSKHVSEASTIRAYKKWMRMGYQGVTVLDVEGNEMTVMPDYNSDHLIYMD